MSQLFTKIGYILMLLVETVGNFIGRKQLYYIVESADWSIKHDGISITGHLKGLKSRVTSSIYGIRNAIVHYGSINKLLTSKGVRLAHSSNKIAVTWFHVVPDQVKIKQLTAQLLKRIDIWHTSCQITKTQLINLGIPENKIRVIPLGVNLECFAPASKKEKNEKREQFGIPGKKIVIGSFQKDGEGWGQGLKPKLIKGPDIFCDVLESLARDFEIMALLTGPARGYVKKRLTAAGIPFLHFMLKNPDDVAQFYKMIDLYLVTSRVEGGPKSILESLASGIPLITTKVGMAPDIIVDQKNGYLCDDEDINCIIAKVKNIFQIIKSGKKVETIDTGLKTVNKYSWQKAALKYKEKIYDQLT